MVAEIGLLGALLLPVAWLLARHRAYEAGGVDAGDPRAAGLYAAASLLLAYHAFQLRDLPFIVLTVSMTMFTTTELLLLLYMNRNG